MGRWVAFGLGLSRRAQRDSLVQGLRREGRVDWGVSRTRKDWMAADDPITCVRQERTARSAGRLTVKRVSPGICCSRCYREVLPSTCALHARPHTPPMGGWQSGRLGWGGRKGRVQLPTEHRVSRDNKYTGLPASFAVPLPRFPGSHGKIRKAICKLMDLHKLMSSH